MLNIEKFELTVADYVYIFTIFILVFIGLSAIYSASYQVESSYLKANFSRQVVWFLMGTFFLVITVVLPTRVLFAVSYWLYGLSILLLILTLVLNSNVSVSRWITIGGVQFQPSEIMKISTVLALARYLSFKKRNLNNIKELSIAFGLILFPFLLISQQPDLGTAFVFLAVIFPVLYWAGLPTFYLLVIIMPFVVLIASFNYYAFSAVMIFTAAMLLFFRSGLLVFLSVMIFNIIIGIFTPFLWSHLRGYQKHRILTFLGVEIDPHGLSYQIIQSKVAIGSGGFFGKGILNGTQTQLRFLPAQHTDFVFSVIGEELGFIGSVFVLGLFLFLLLRGIYICSIVKNKFLSLLVIGAIVVLGFHTIINIGMTVGIMPVTGLPLPFMSYGGTFLITSMILVGFVIHASIRRFRY